MPDIDIEDKDSMLMPMINMLKKEQKFIVEIDCLEEFPDNIILPLPNCIISTCRPKRVIKYLQYMHSSAELNPVRSIHYTYKIHDTDRTYMDTYTFTSNMSLVNDVIIICYLYCFEPQYRILPGIDELINMMMDKYVLLLDEVIDQLIPYSPITFYHVLHSFPSIGVACTNASMKIPSSNLCKSADFVLPTIRKRMIWCDLIASVLPRFDSDLTSLICLEIMKKDLFKMRNTVKNLFNIENPEEKIFTTNELYHCKAFPYSLKLKLCERWDIIEKVNEEHNQYKYVDYFKKFISEVASSRTPTKAE
ncbi:uncharacterized protein LOC114933706 [Nylanderia fulva]|uniref:uncharacterized protein LOC114933706 n=1 Tax=Nylanderia fulva TaxID=613905 RepID=UPI0010FADC97|nr:uncharacterized protein LOC114933706 [Nylanderia fulva]